MAITNPKTNSPIIYKGFSTVGAERTRNWSLYNIDLVKRDLQNHFQTRIGERCVRPDWGCRVWDYLFEPLNDSTRAKIVAAAMEVINAEPRVKIINMNVIEYDQGIRIEIVCEYLIIGIVDTMFVNFDKSTTSAWGG